jgi:phospholipid/cholesterol/gamma-HCH transport system substrate-binding protein
MNPTKSDSRLAPAWWTAILIVVIVAVIVVTYLSFNRSFTSRVAVTLSADRSGVMLEPGSKVKVRGVDVGEVASVNRGRQGTQPVGMNLELDPGQLRYIPANVEAEIKATTAFGNKYVDLISPANPSAQRLAAGAHLTVRNVSTEVNTVFENLVKLLDQIDPAKINAVLSTLAEGLGGQGERIGEAISAGDRVLKEINPRSETIRGDFQALGAFSDTFGGAAQNLISTLDAISTTSTTITNHEKDLDSLLLSAIGLSNSGIELLGPNKDNLKDAINTLEPTTELLLKYNPEYTCLLQGAKWFLDNGGYYTAGGHNGYSLIADAGLLFGNDPYIYPDNLPIVAAKGGPGGKPGCGSLPDPTKNFPVRQLITNTGWGTGVDVRPNLGLGHPCYGNWVPATRAVPEIPSIRCPAVHGDDPHWNYPSPGLVTPPGAPFGYPMNAWPTAPAPPQEPAPAPAAESVPPVQPGQ